MRHIFVLFIFVGLFRASTAEAGIVNIIDRQVRTIARDTDETPSQDEVLDISSIPDIAVSPYEKTSSATVGDALSTTEIDYTGTNSWAILGHDVAHERGGSSSDLALSIGDYLDFTVNSNTTYEIDSRYTTNVVSETNAGDTYHRVFLYDTTDSKLLMETLNRSVGVIDEEFTAGIASGDTSAQFTGSLTGNLEVGHEYRFFFYMFTWANPDADSGATADGYATLTIGDAPVGQVPEPTSLAIFALGALGLAGGAIRRRRKKSRR